MLGFDVQRPKHCLIRWLIKAEERHCIVTANTSRDLHKLRLRTLRAADFNHMNLIVVGRSVLRCCKSAKAFVSNLTGFRRVSPQVADEKPCKKWLFISKYIKHKQLHLSRLHVNFTGDFHGR